MILAPMRRRGTLAQQTRRIKKWTRRGRTDLVRKHWPGVWRVRRRAEADARWISSGVLAPDEVRQLRFGGGS